MSNGLGMTNVPGRACSSRKRSAFSATLGLVMVWCWLVESRERSKKEILVLRMPSDEGLHELARDEHLPIRRARVVQRAARQHATQSPSRQLRRDLGVKEGNPVVPRFPVGQGRRPVGPLDLELVFLGVLDHPRS